MEESIIKDKSVEVIQNIRKDFTEESTLPIWHNYSAVSRFKSVRRAIRRGHVDIVLGLISPKRPYNNRKMTKGRSYNQLRRVIYEQLRGL